MYKINKERIKDNLISLSQIGKSDDGGVTRLAYSKEYFEGLEFVKRQMEKASLTTTIDEVGNLFGIRKGRTDKVILIGSHTDTVVNGGIFDGTLGVLGAIEAMHTLSENNVMLEHTIVVANWAEEEGNVIRGLIGSGSFIGALDDMAPHIETKLKIHGLSTEKIKASKCDYLEKIKAYLELHIEQGAILYNTHTDIGVVNAIVGEERYLVTIFGKENHAGTTPMEYRDDALIKASKLILELNEKCKEIDSTMVCTVGYIKAFPGEQNIIPGKVQMTVEVRSVNEDSIAKFTDFMKKSCENLGANVELTLLQKPVKMSEECVFAIDKATKSIGLSSKIMHSGAGHDAMMIATVIRNSGMIFVPSVDGLSHCPEEFTKWSDVENGTNVLLNAILNLDSN